jgi:tRNA threonylcarbamoyladenosine biosynthesis protein TsaE
MDFKVRNLSDLQPVIMEMIRLVNSGLRLFLLKGELGAGKTTLVQQFCRQIGVTEPVSSPTFSLINGYSSPEFGLVYHMDFYRLEKSAELSQIGLEEYLETTQLLLIEWPDIAMDLLEPPFVVIEIHADANNIRIFKITTHDTVVT